jgi:hypothetical protein
MNTSLGSAYQVAPQRAVSTPVNQGLLDLTHAMAVAARDVLEQLHPAMLMPLPDSAKKYCPSYSRVTTECSNPAMRTVGDLGAQIFSAVNLAVRQGQADHGWSWELTNGNTVSLVHIPDTGGVHLNPYSQALTLGVVQLEGPEQNNDPVGYRLDVSAFVPFPIKRLSRHREQLSAPLPGALPGASAVITAYRSPTTPKVGGTPTPMLRHSLSLLNGHGLPDDLDAHHLLRQITGAHSGINWSVIAASVALMHWNAIALNIPSRISPLSPRRMAEGRAVLLRYLLVAASGDLDEAQMSTLCALLPQWNSSPLDLLSVARSM